jgi:predicted transcriptional regulator
VVRKKRGKAVSAQGLLGPLEYAAMEALWEGAPANVGTVLKRINTGRSDDEQLAYTTVMTVLARLHDKGILERAKAGRGYDYTPRFAEGALVDHMSRQEVGDLVDRYGVVALTQFADALREADPKLLARLVAIADQQAADG